MPVPLHSQADARIRRRSIAAGVAALLLLVAVWAVAAPAPARTPQAMLPDSFAGWNATAHATFSASQAASFEDAASAAATGEFGFESAEQDTYARGGDTLRVIAYRMKDPSGAYGEYLYLRAPRMTRARLGERSSISEKRALVLIGNIVLAVNGPNLPAHSDDLGALVAAVKPRAEMGLLPTVTDHLPARKMIPGSERYILGPQTLNQFVALAPGDWLEFSYGAESAIAKYKLSGRGDATLIITDYPTPQLAEHVLNELEKQFDVNDSKGAGAQPNSRPLFASRSVTFLAIVVGAHSRAEAGILLDQVHSGEEVTWDAPTLGLNQPEWTTVIAGIAIGTCILCVFSLIAGIAFGGVRLVVKRFFPSQIFDRGGYVDILQLGLNSKPIKAEDFYQFSGRG